MEDSPLENHWFPGALSFSFLEEINLEILYLLPFLCQNGSSQLYQYHWWENICYIKFRDFFLILTDKVTLSCPRIISLRKMMRCPLSAHCQETMESWAVMRSLPWRNGAMSVVWTKMIIITTTQSGKSSTSVACVSTGTSTITCAVQAMPIRTRVPSTLTTLGMPGLWYFR